MDFVGSYTMARERQGKVPTGDDIILARSKGFDKHSFRKEKINKEKSTYEPKNINI